MLALLKLRSVGGLASAIIPSSSRNSQFAAIYNHMIPPWCHFRLCNYGDAYVSLPPPPQPRLPRSATIPHCCCSAV